jgi:hypothetical protein
MRVQRMAIREGSSAPHPHPHARTQEHALTQQQSIRSMRLLSSMRVQRMANALRQLDIGTRC